MSKTRREKRKLKRLSTNPKFVKPYNAKVRRHNEGVRIQKAKNKKREVFLSLGVLGVAILIIIAKIWLN